MIEPREKHLSVTRTARVVESGDPARARTVWYLLHGYGQLASEFLRACDVLSSPDRMLVAPEGLSRFYTRGLSEAPGASWMTREDRDAEIADQLSYLDAVHAEVLARLAGPPDRVVLLGFSQGATTADRWVATSRLLVDPELVLWAGAPAMDLGAGTRRAKTFILAYGTRDPFLTPKAITSVKKLLDLRAQRHETVTFEGDHAIHPPTLSALAGRLDP